MKKEVKEIKKEAEKEVKTKEVVCPNCENSGLDCSVCGGYKK